MLDWLPIGPVGRGDPVWYVGLRNLNCAALPEYAEPLSTMEEAAQALCLGLEGNQAAWEQGVSALEAMAQPIDGVSDCYSVAAYEVLQSVAAFRKQKPNVPVELAALPGTACQPDLKALENDAADSPPAEVCAGDAIVLFGNLTGLPTGSVRSVNVGTTTAPVWQRRSFTDSNHPFEFYFLAPPLQAGDPTTATVTVADADYPVAGSATFDYAADQDTCQQAPGTAP